MPLASNAEVPTLSKVFGSHSKVMHAFEMASIYSVVPVMFLPREALRTIKGIGPHASLYVTGALAQEGLGHREYVQKTLQFMEQEFGGLESTPVAALHVITASSELGAQPIYAPVRLLHFLSEIEPQMVVRDLVSMTEADIRDMVTNRFPFGPIAEVLSENVVDINWRLSRFDPNLRITQTQRQSHLRAVNE
jgi:hypothetical protein